jgi:quinol monooxygenase YgiN
LIVSNIEIYSKWRLQAGAMSDFIAIARSLAGITLQQNPATLRCDWFANETKNEAVSMAVHRDTAALRSHVASAGALYGRLTQLASMALQWVGRPPTAALEALPMPATIADFHSGQAANTGADKFSRDITGQPVPHIEIFTHFAVHPGKLAEFKVHARECLDIVVARDPGTSRYDWFYDDANLVSLALDTYNDPHSMFAHMKNCHDAHEKLLHLSTMTTEFLGEPPAAILAAISKYNPYIVKFIAGLKPYSSGGFR